MLIYSSRYLAVAYIYKCFAIGIYTLLYATYQKGKQKEKREREMEKREGKGTIGNDDVIL